MAEDLETFDVYSDKSSSKKPDAQRRQELIKVMLKPLETFFEEHLQFYLLECNKNFILR